MSDFWTIRDYLDARKSGNEAMLAMIQCYFDGSNRMDDEPEEALAYFKRGRSMAQELNKPWWMLFFDHWTLQTFLFSTRNFNEALELAVKATVNARKPEVADCPTRICVHEDLITVYTERDPIGYADLIENAIAYMEGELTGNSSCHFCLKGRRIHFELALDRVENATNEAQHYLSITENTKHYRVHALGNLSEIAYLSGDWSMLLHWARAGEPLAQEENRREWVGTFLAWQTLAHYMLGNEVDARTVLRLVEGHTANMRPMQSGSYYDALSTYYEATGDLEAALRLRETQVRLCAGSGRYYNECRYRLKHCRLLVQLGKPLAASLAELRAVAAKLLKPDKILIEIEKLTSGNIQ